MTTSRKLPKGAKTVRKKLQEKQQKKKVVLGNATRAMPRSFKGSFLREASAPQKRDMNKECGYPDVVTLDDILELYDREGVARRVVHVYPVETWKNHPSIYEVLDENKTTPFEEAVSEFVTRFHLWAMLERADILSSIGHFGGLFIGFNDGEKDLSKPVRTAPADYAEVEGYKAKKAAEKLDVLYFRPLDERYITVNELESNPASPMCGRPKTYKITFTTEDDLARMTGGSSGKTETIVHWTRVLHLAPNRESSEVFAVPPLRVAFNRVYDLLKITGGSAEMFFKGGFPGLSFELQPGLQSQVAASGIDFDEDAFKEEIEAYANGLQRYLRVIGLTVKSLAPQAADPTPHIDAAMDQICITINCPKRIFLGTESAHLASTQDQKTWSDRIDGRRQNYAVPYIIRRLVGRLMAFGVLPFVDKYFIDWADPEEVDPLVRAQAMEKIVNAMAQYVSSGLATLITPMDFLTKIYQLDNETAKEIYEAALAQSRMTKNRLPLVQATDKQKMEERALESKAQQQKAASRNGKAAGTGRNGPNGRKSGTGAKRSIADRSTGQAGG